MSNQNSQWGHSGDHTPVAGRKSLPEPERVKFTKIEGVLYPVNVYPMVMEPEIPAWPVGNHRRKDQAIRPKVKVSTR